MPTSPRKARLLLKEGKAKITGREPLTIQLLYSNRGYTQPITLGIDAGYEAIGYSAVTKKEELVGGEMKLLEGVSERITSRRKLRRTEGTRLLLKYNYKGYEGEDLLNAAIEENVLTQVENLRSYPVIHAKLYSGRLNLHAWVYQIETGGIYVYSPERCNIQAEHEEDNGAR